jgi:hypothetical protein
MEKIKIIQNLQDKISFARPTYRLNVRIILKITFKTQGVKMWNGFNWFGTGFNGEIL